MYETKELGNWVHSIQLTWLAGTRYNRELVLTEQIANASQEITEGGIRVARIGKRDCACVSIGAKRECERMVQAALIENIPTQPSQVKV